MGGKVYFMRVDNMTEDRTEVMAYGDLRAMVYHAREAKNVFADAKPDAKVRVLLTEKAKIEGQDIRTVIDVTAEPDVVTYVLAKKLRAERAAQADAEPAIDPATI